MNARERAVQLRLEGLSLSEVSEVLNREGYRMDMGGIFDKKGRGAWNYSTRKAGERCPQAGFWNTTCSDDQDGMLYLSSGDVFPDCTASCDHCKWEIKPTEDERTSQRPSREKVVSDSTENHTNHELEEDVEARLNRRIDELARILKEDIVPGVSCIHGMMLNMGNFLGIGEDDLLE